MVKRKQLSVDEWCYVGVACKEVAADLDMLAALFYGRRMKRVTGRILKMQASYLSQIKSDLEEVMFAQHPGLDNSALKVFYGGLIPCDHTCNQRNLTDDDWRQASNTCKKIDEGCHRILNLMRGSWLSVKMLDRLLKLSNIHLSNLKSELFREMHSVSPHLSTGGLFL